VYQGIFPGLNLPGREADHPSVRTTIIKMREAVTPFRLNFHGIVINHSKCALSNVCWFSFNNLLKFNGTYWTLS
jgi:hypothetical protein